MASSIPGQKRQTTQLTLSIMGKLKPARIFKNAVEQLSSSNQPATRTAPPRHITGLTFDDDGHYVLTAGEDEAYRVYNCRIGKSGKQFYSKKYGIDLPRFTHDKNSIIYASTKEDDTIRYASLHDNKYLQYFRGHSQRVISLEMSPIDDTFISSSMDQTVRLWDLRSSKCRGLLHTPTIPIAAFETSGTVFAVGHNSYNRIALYDRNNFDKEPFLYIEIHDPYLIRISHPPRIPFMTSMQFSQNGKYLLVGTSGDCHYVADAFTGEMIAKLEGHQGLERGKGQGNSQLGVTPHKGISGEEVTWTPDSRYVISGSHDGKIVVWDLSEEKQLKGVPKGQDYPAVQPIQVLDGHSGPSRCVKFNPRYAMMASASSELAFWLPDNSVDGEMEAKKVLSKMGLT